MSKYNLTDILNEYVGGSRHGTINISYRDLQDAMDQVEANGDFIVRELPGPSGDGKTNREFEVVFIGGVKGNNKQEELGFTVYDYKFGFDPASENNFDEVLPFSIGGSNKEAALKIAKYLLGNRVQGYMANDKEILRNFDPKDINDVLFKGEVVNEGNLDDLRKLKDDLSGALEDMKKKAEELKLDVDFGDATQAVNKYIDDVFDADYKRSGGRIDENIPPSRDDKMMKDLAKADEVIKMIKMMNPDVRDDLLIRIARMGQGRMDEEKNGMKLSKKNYADYHKDNKKKVDELSMGKKDKDDDGESKFRSAQYGIGDAFVDAVKKRMQKEMQTLPNPIMRHGFEGDNYQEKETERMRRDGSSGESQKSMASVPFYQRDVRYDDDFFIDELNDGELDESFDSLVKKVDKAKGYSKKDAQRVAGFIANRKRAGAGSGPTKKMKKREGIKEAPGSTINLSKDDMDKLHSDGKLEIDGHKVIYKVNENGDVKDYADELKESTQEESVAKMIQDYYRNPKTGESMISDEIVMEYFRTMKDWDQDGKWDGTDEGNEDGMKDFNEFFDANYGYMFPSIGDIDESLKSHFNRFK